MDIWVVFLTLLSLLCLLMIVYRMGRIRGFYEGSHKVLKQWKDTLNDMED